VTTFIRDLGHLDRPLGGSSIACIMDACMGLLGGLLDELQIMKEIEAEVVGGEKEWVENRLRGIARDGGSSLGTVTDEVAAWRE
jgi:hypothetical protein